MSLQLAMEAQPEVSTVSRPFPHVTTELVRVFDVLVSLALLLISGLTGSAHIYAGPAWMSCRSFGTC